MSFPNCYTYFIKEKLHLGENFFYKQQKKLCINDLYVVLKQIN